VLFVSIAVGRAPAGARASAYPLFISASASELVKARIQEVPSARWAVGMMYRRATCRCPDRAWTAGPSPVPTSSSDRLVAQSPYLAEPVESALAGLVPISGRDERTRAHAIVLRRGCRVQRRDPRGSPGRRRLVPDQIADALGISPGDRVVVGSPDVGAVTLPVDAVYRSLYKGEASDYWRPWKDDLVFYECPRDCPPPPPQALIVPREPFEPQLRTVGLDHAAYAWQAPLARDLTLGRPRTPPASTTRISEQIDESALLDRCFVGFFCTHGRRRDMGQRHGGRVDAVHERLIAIEGPASLLRAAGISGRSRRGRRGRRLRHGHATAWNRCSCSPEALDPRRWRGRAALEALLPCAIGAGAGLASPSPFVVRRRPERSLVARRSSEALAAAGFASVAAIVAIAAVSTASFLRQSEHHRRRFAVLGALPWELILIALSLVILERLRRGGAAGADRRRTPRRRACCCSRSPSRSSPASSRSLRGRSCSCWAGQGQERSVGDARVPGGASARRPAAAHDAPDHHAGLCLGLFVQAQTVARSMATTVDAKAGAYVGSDVQVRINDYNETPNRLPASTDPRRATTLRRSARGDVRSTCWPSTPTPSLPPPSGIPRSLQSRSTTSSDDSRRPSEGTLPVLVASAPLADPSSVTIDGRTVPVEMVGRADAFPGMLSGRPLVVVDAERLVDAFEGKGDPLSGRAGATSSGSEAIPPSSGMRLPDSATGRTSSSRPTRSRTSRTSRRSSARSS
jgi:putative ABC transport system permease protein